MSALIKAKMENCSSKKDITFTTAMRGERIHTLSAVKAEIYFLMKITQLQQG